VTDNATATFGLDLRDGITPSAQNAQEALAQLQQRLTGTQKELNGIYAAQRRLRQGGLGQSTAFKDLDARASILRQSLGAMQAQYVQLGGSFRNDAGIRQAKGGFDDFLGTATRIPGPLGMIASRFASLGAAGPVGLAIAAAFAVAAAYVAVAVAIAAATAALLKYGVAQADARRNELLRLQGLTTIRRWHGIAAGSATDLQKSIDRVSRSSAIGREEVLGYAESLYRAGLRGQTLEDALKGVTTVAAVQGDQMASRWQGMAIAAARTGGSVRRMADQVERRLGPIARRMALSWDRQMERMRESVGELFSGLEIEGLLEAAHGITELFSQSTFTGRALKQLMTSLLQPLIDFIVARGPTISRFFKGMVIAALVLAIAIVRVKNRLRDAFEGTSLGGLFDFIDAADLGEAVVYGLAGAVVFLLAVLAPLALVVAAIAAPFVLAAIAGVFFGKKIRELAAWLGALDWSELGANLVDGLVERIRSGSRLVTDTVRELGQSARDALADVLGIASPSRVFAELGRQVPRGFAVGVDSESDVAQDSVADVVSPADGVAGGGGGATAAAASSVSVRIDGGLHVHVASADEVPSGIAERIREAIAAALEGVVVQTGAAR
jgi:hypothetical protein